MKLRSLLSINSGILFFAAAHQSTAAPLIELSDHAFNINGTFTPSSDPIPGAVDASSFDLNTGLGTLTVTVQTAGAGYVGLFLEHDIDAPINTFSNEFGSTTGVPVAGQSFEIDERVSLSATSIRTSRQALWTTPSELGCRTMSQWLWPGVLF